MMRRRRRRRRRRGEEKGEVFLWPDFRATFLRV
jgi:hypothetical protein